MNISLRSRAKIDLSYFRRQIQLGYRPRVLTLLVAFSFALLTGCQGQSSTDNAQTNEQSKSEKPAADKRMMTVPSVSIITPLIRTEPITKTAAGTLASPNAVTLIPQVSGTIQSVHVRSGQQVKKGDLLFSLDKQPFETALRSAEAKLKGDRAQSRYASEQVQLLKPLVEKEYITRQSYEQAVATAMAANALISQDEAAIETARINLSYTQIRAPITGRLGEISLQPGNLVVANNTALSTLVSNRQLLVNFSLPQTILTALRDEWPGLGQTKTGQNPPLPPKVEILDEKADHVIGKGHLSFIDNSISANTGTIRLQGLIDNPEGTLWPGQFVTARLTLGKLPNAQIIPSNAVQIGDQGMYVYVYQEGKAHMASITPAFHTAHEAVLPANSLPADTKIIYPLPSRIAPGMAVRLKPAEDKNAEKTSKAEPSQGDGAPQARSSPERCAQHAMSDLA